MKKMCYFMRNYSMNYARKLLFSLELKLLFFLKKIILLLYISLHVYFSRLTFINKNTLLTFISFYIIVRKIEKKIDPLVSLASWQRPKLRWKGTKGDNSKLCHVFFFIYIINVGVWASICLPWLIIWILKLIII